MWVKKKTAYSGVPAMVFEKGGGSGEVLTKVVVGVQVNSGLPIVTAVPNIFLRVLRFSTCRRIKEWSKAGGAHDAPQMMQGDQAPQAGRIIFCCWDRLGASTLHTKLRGW